MNARILCVDDDPNILAAYQRNLRKQFTLVTALGADEALAKMSEDNHFAVVVADMQMPGMNGVQFLIKAEQLAPDTVRMMLTGNADQQTAKEAVNRGHIFRFLSKPCTPEELAGALTAAVKQHGLITAERELLENTLSGSVKLLSEILSFSSPEAFGRGQALREVALQIAGELQLEQTWDLGLAALLSQIGCLTLPAALLAKLRGGTEPTQDELHLLGRVPEIGSNLLTQIPRLESVAAIVQYQHKYFDGTGFPPGDTAGAAIPMGARILKVASDMIHLESRGLTRGKALEGMLGFKERYDPDVLRAACTHFGHGNPDAPPIQPIHEEIAVKDLRAGMVLSQDVRGLDGSILASPGTRISAFLLEILVNYHRLQGLKEPIQIFTQKGTP